MDADRRNETDIFRYTDVEYTPDGHSELYRWDDFLGITGGHAYSAMAMLSAITGCRIQAYGTDTLIYRASLGSSAAAKLAAGALAMKDRLSGRGDAVEIGRGDCENAGTFTVKPGRYEPILGIYDPVGGCGGAMGTVLDCDFEIDPHDISYTMMEPVRGEWKSDRIDLYTPQDCFGFSDPFGGRIEYNEKKPEVAVAAKPDPVELGHRASVAAGSTAGDRARGAGIRQ